MSHQIFMQRCIQLANNGFPAVTPNPMVGCVIVLDGKIIGEGFHRQFGGPHAEVHAINSVKNKELLKSSILYVSLEPCSHHGKTPPCADLIIKHKIPHVVIASIDPNKEVSGNGILKLQQAGIKVESGILDQESRDMNARFYTFHEKKRPYIILKFAKCQNGFMASDEEKQVWISNEYSQQLVHKWRGEEQAIMIGTNTARIDNPQLNNRFDDRPDPLRIVIDKDLSLADHLHLFDQNIPTVVINSQKNESTDKLEYVKMNFDQTLTKQILDYLYSKSIQSIMIEGGAFTLQSFIDQNLWDEARVFIGALKLENGLKAPSISGKIIAKKEIKGDELLIYRNQIHE